jgi:hypothetical protein
MEDNPVGRGWKPVTHIKMSEYAYAGGNAAWGFRSDPVHTVDDWAEYVGPNAYWIAFRGNVQSALPSLDSATIMYPKTLPEQLNDTKAKIYDDNDVDTLLNIIEAPQLVSSVGSLKKTLESTRVSRALSLVSNGYLMWSFGIAPLLSDMGKVQSAMKTYRSDLKKHLAQGGKERIIRTKVQGSVVPAYIDATGTGSPAHFTSSGGTVRTVSLRAVTHAKYNTAAFGQLDYLMRRFGATGPVSFVWERIPFSFVVDWFLDLRSITGKLDNLFTGAEKNISGGLVTEKGTIVMSMIDDYDYHLPRDFKGTTVASKTYELYKRTIPNYSGVSVTSSGRFGNKQLALTGALLYQLVASRFQNTSFARRNNL